MHEKLEFLVRTLLIGAGATLVMDAWLFLLRQMGISTLNLAYLGRWIGHLRNGQFVHQSIAKAAPIKGEVLIGWCSHYAIGISFAAVLLGIFGLDWARSPSLDWDCILRPLPPCL